MRKRLLPASGLLATLRLATPAPAWAPDAVAPVRIVSGYWRKIYACSIDRFVYQLREGTFNDSIRFRQPGCETIGGTSGSPIIHAITGASIGIHNTGNESGGRCTGNNPCEIAEHGTTVVEKGRQRARARPPPCLLTKPR